MNILVEKYGGTSVASIEQIKSIAQHVVSRHNQGHSLVIVVSAMGKTTDTLVEMVDRIGPGHNHRELGMLLSTGEVVTCSLLAMAIQALVKKAT